MVIAAIEHIAISPNICHGAPHIVGTRIRVQDIVMFYRNGWSVEKIATQSEHLKLSQIHAALAYYYDHQAEIDAEIKKDEAIARQVGGTRRQDLKAASSGKGHSDG
jgi:uncharacterized protein (DUF433 family)